MHWFLHGVFLMLNAASHDTHQRLFALSVTVQ